MPTFNLEIVNESNYNFNLCGEHLVSGSWASVQSSPKSSAPKKVTTLLPKQTTSMTFVASFAQVSGSLTFISSGREIPIFIQVAFTSPIVGAPCLNARVSSRPRTLHDFVSSVSSVAAASETAIIDGEGCYWTMRSDPAKKGPINTLFVQVEDSLAAGGSAVAAEQQQPASAGLFILKVENQSAIEFRFDGEFIVPSPPTLPRSSVSARSVVEANGGWSSSHSQVALPANAGGCWWYRGVDVDGNAYFLSLAVYTNALGKTFFYASCGPPPADLAHVYSHITGKSSHSVSSSKLNSVVSCEGCQWTTTQRGGGKNTVVELKIDQNLTPYNALNYPPAVDEKEKASASPAEPSQEPPSLEVATSSATASSSLLPTAAAGAEQQSAVSSTDASDKEEDSKAVEKSGEDFMNSSRPKNIFGGFASAVKCVGAGFVAGGVALFAAPAVGYKESGLKGFAGGLLQGVVGGAALAAAGVVAGGAQVVRGVVNTPEAIHQGLKSNMKWDNELGAWVQNTVVLRDLVASAEEEAKADDAQERSQSGFVAGRSVKETRFYDLLGVAPDTPPAGLKKAYYKAAVRCHPDKNPDDPEAHAKFQDLSKAYNVLSDDAARARYDELGESGIAEQGQAQFDAMLFFSVLFGSEKFEPYVGELAIATVAAKMFSNAEKHVVKGGLSAEGAKDEMMQHSETADRDKRHQRRRVIRLADQLASRLATYVQEGLQDEFVTAAYIEAQTLVHQSFGPQLLCSLGWVYSYRARKFLSGQGLSFNDGGGLEVMASLKKSRRGAAQKLAIGANIFKSVRAVQGIAEAGQDKGESEDKTIKTGCYVKINGLKNRPELNDVVGVVMQVEGESAVIATQGVEGSSDVRQLKIKLENLQFMQAGADDGSDPTKALLAENMPLLLNTAWSLSALDIESSASRAAKYVTRDIGVPWQMRFKRARALLLLGKIFSEVGAAHASSTSDADAGLDSSAAMKKVEDALASSVKEKK